VILVILLALNVLATLYTIKDAQKRGMNATGWGAFVLLTTAAGLPIYMLARRRKTA